MNFFPSYFLFGVVWFCVVIVLLSFNQIGFTFAATNDPKDFITPIELPGSESYIYYDNGKVQLRLFVYKPDNWNPLERIACFVFFFGGGWVGGNPTDSHDFARWATDHQMIAVTPDYRTKTRYDSIPEDCITDSRNAMKWVQLHSFELGINPALIVVSGASAGGHLAAWSAINGPGPGDDDPGPLFPPPFLVILFYPVTDTTETGFGGPYRFGHSEKRAKAASLPHQMPLKFPPTLIFHAKGDDVVSSDNSVDFRDRLVDAGNQCELILFEGLGHSYFYLHGKEAEEAFAITKKKMFDFLKGYSPPLVHSV